MNECYEAAELLARTLQGLARDPGWGHEQQSRDDADIAWQAASFFAKILLEAQPLESKITRVVAEDAIEAYRSELDNAGRHAEAKEMLALADLEKAGFARVVVGEVHVPEAVWINRTGGAWDALPAGQRAAIETLVKRLQTHESESKWWIGRIPLDERREAHAQAHASTPGLEELVTAWPFQAATRNGVEGFDLPTNSHGSPTSFQGLWASICPKVLALIWHTLLAQTGADGAGAALVRWLPYSDLALHWPNAIELTDRSERKAFLDAATALILEEPDLKGWEPEKTRQQRENEAEAFRHESRRDWPVAAPPTPLVRYQWNERESGNWRGDTVRGMLGLLLHVIVKYDDDTGAYQQRYGRIRQLLLAGAEAPWLSWEVPRQVVRARRDALAWWLTEVDTAPLAFHLIESLSIDVPTWALDQQQRMRRQEERRNTVWAQAWQVFGPVVKGRPSNAVGAVGDIVLNSSQAVIHRAWNGNDLGVRDLRVAREEINWRVLESMRLSNSWRPTGVAAPYAAPVLRELTSDLIKRFVETVQAPGNDSDVRFPVAEMRILCRLIPLLPIGEEPQLNVIRSPQPSQLSVARCLAATYSKELRKTVYPAVVTEQGHQDAVSWYGTHADVVRLPWADVLIVLHRAGEQDELLAPLDIREALTRVPDLARDLSEQQTGSTYPKRIGYPDRETAQFGLDYRLTDAWLNKLHLHFRILLTMDEALRDRRIRIPTDDLRRTVVRAMVGDRIIELLRIHRRLDLSLGTVDLFRDHVGFGDSVDTATLVQDTARAIELFGKDQRETALRLWLSQVTDVRVILQFARAASSPDAYERALQRLTDLDDDRLFDGINNLRTLSQLATDAASIELVTLAERVLAKGDALCGGTDREAYWRYWSYEPRLLLAYRNVDPTVFESVPVPVLPPRPLHGDNAEKLKNTKDFYTTLVTLRGDPGSSVQQLNQILSKRPDAWSVALNRFAARLEMARRAVPDAREKAAIQALEEWDSEVAPHLTPEAKGAMQFEIHYNRLSALRYARQFEAFDAYRTGVSVDMRAKLSMVELVAETLIEQGRADELPGLLADAKEQHRSVDGTIPTALEDVERKIEKSAPHILAAAGLPIESERSVTVPEHRRHFHDILNLHPDRLVRVVAGGQPEASDPVSTFLLSHHFETARVLLDRMTSLPDDENKRNDLFQSLLQARLLYLGWSVSDQPRGGSSYGGGNSLAASAGVGERDWLVRTRDASLLAVTEAFRVSSIETDKIDLHLMKLRTYDPSSVVRAFAVVYFEGADFPGFASRYLQHLRGLPLGEWKYRNSRVLSSPEFVQVGNVKIIQSEYEDATNSNIVTVYHLLLRIPSP